jgi:hypothetical protein
VTLIVSKMKMNKKTAPTVAMMMAARMMVVTTAAMMIAMTITIQIKTAILTTIVHLTHQAKKIRSQSNMLLMKVKTLQKKKRNRM